MEGFMRESSSMTRSRAEENLSTKMGLTTMANGIMTWKMEQEFMSNLMVKGRMVLGVKVNSLLRTETNQKQCKIGSLE